MIEGGAPCASGFLTVDAAANVSYETNTAGSTLKRRFSARPTMRIGRRPPGPITVTVSPIAKPRSSSMSLATPSPSPRGSRPSTIVVGAPGPLNT